MIRVKITYTNKTVYRDFKDWHAACLFCRTEGTNCIDWELLGKQDNTRRHMEIEERVIAKIENRRDVGRKKYGVTMERTDLDFLTWLQHAQDEMLDAAIYLEKMIRMNEKPELHDAAPAKK